MIKYVFLLLIFASFLKTNGLTVSGIIMDANTKETIPDATVYYDQTFKGTITDKDGHFELQIVNNCSLPLVFSRY